MQQASNLLEIYKQDKTLFDYLNVFYTAYIDDILIYSQNAKEHEKHVKQVF
jgi:hypothetical protein